MEILFGMPQDQLLLPKNQQARDFMKLC